MASGVMTRMGLSLSGLQRRPWRSRCSNITKRLDRTSRKPSEVGGNYAAIQTSSRRSKTLGWSLEAERFDRLFF